MKKRALLFTILLMLTFSSCQSFLTPFSMRKNVRLKPGTIAILNTSSSSYSDEMAHLFDISFSKITYFKVRPQESIKAAIPGYPDSTLYDWKKPWGEEGKDFASDWISKRNYIRVKSIQQKLQTDYVYLVVLTMIRYTGSYGRSYDVTIEGRLMKTATNTMVAYTNHTVDSGTWGAMFQREESVLRRLIKNAIIDITHSIVAQIEEQEEGKKGKKK